MAKISTDSEILKDTSVFNIRQLGNRKELRFLEYFTIVNVKMHPSDDAQYIVVVHRFAVGRIVFGRMSPWG